MRTDISQHPWAKYFQPYLDGVELRHCRMADEEMGCAEVYQTDETGARRPEWGTKMVFGVIEDRPINDVAARIKANPEQAQAIWDEYYLAMKAQWEAEDRELVASGWPRKPAARPAPHRRHWLSFDEMMGGLFLRGLE